MSRAALRRVLHSALDETAGPLVVDMCGVQFMDAAGIGALIDATRRAGTIGRRVLVRNPSAAVRRLVEVLGPGLPFETD